MPRTKGSKNKPKPDDGSEQAAAPKPTKTAPAAPIVGHNAGLGGLTDDQQRGLFLNGVAAITALLAQSATINSEIRRKRKEMKADGFEQAQINYAIWLRKVPENVPVRKRIDEVKIAKWLAHPVGHQAELFGDGVDRTPAIDRAFEEGKTAGLAGANKTPPYAESTPQGQKWLHGWDEGQAVNHIGFRTLQTAQEEQPPDTMENALDDANEALEDVRPRFMQADQQEHPREQVDGEA